MDTPRSTRCLELIKGCQKYLRIDKLTIERLFYSYYFEHMPLLKVKNLPILKYLLANRLYLYSPNYRFVLSKKPTSFSLEN